MNLSLSPFVYIPDCIIHTVRVVSRTLGQSCTKSCTRWVRDRWTDSSKILLTGHQAKQPERRPADFPVWAYNRQLSHQPSLAALKGPPCATQPTPPTLRLLPISKAGQKPYFSKQHKVSPVVFKDRRSLQVRNINHLGLLAGTAEVVVTSLVSPSHQQAISAPPQENHQLYKRKVQEWRAH